MRVKKYFFIVCSSLLLFASLPLTALSEESSEVESSNIKSGAYSLKDEVIYGNLDVNGNVQNMYVVNSFHVSKPGEIVDYGMYTDIRNLTDLSEIELTGSNQVHFQADEDEFYYQGELENQPLPWDISIRYFLDGEEMNPKQLAGQSGHLEIQIETSAHKNVDLLFFNHYLLQISITLDPSIFNDIQAPKGTEANEGKNKLMNFTVMPGQEEELILSAQVTDLKMDPIDISAIPANIAIENPDIGNMTEDMQTLSKAIREINDGVEDLTDGISELNDGAKEISSGSSEYRSGINELDQSSDELVSGSQEILSALQQISGAMQNGGDMLDLDDLEKLPKEFRNIAKEIKEFATTLDAFNDMIQSIPDTVIEDDEIEKIRNVLKDSNTDERSLEVLNQLVQTYQIAQAIKENSWGIPGNLAKLIKNMANHLEKIADTLEFVMDNLGQLDELDDLQVGLTTLSSEYKSFHNGLLSYTEGVSTLATSYEQLDEGTTELSGGISSLDDGVNELHNGTTKLYESTSNLPDQVQSELDKFMDEYDFSNFEPTSFVSDKNKNIGVVQFVLKTEHIKIEESEETIDEKQQKKSFWSRLLDLFS